MLRASRRYLGRGITLHGQFMYPRSAMEKLIELIAAGLLSLQNFEVKSFPLAAINEALRFAADYGGPFRVTTIEPCA
jgi:alcohol dehydrogenase